MKQGTRLQPLIPFKNRQWLLALDRLATINRAELSAPEGSAEIYRDEIIAEIDLLFTGF